MKFENRFEIFENLILQDKTKQLCTIMNYEKISRNTHVIIFNHETKKTFNVNQVELNKNIKKYLKLTEEIKDELRTSKEETFLNEITQSVNNISNNGVCNIIYTEEQIKEMIFRVFKQSIMLLDYENTEEEE